MCVCASFTHSLADGLGRFSVNATSGEVLFGSANKTGNQAYSFEALPNSFTLSVTATQKNDSTMLATNAVKISIVDMNDPPLIARGQVLSALSELAVVGAVAGVVAAADEDRGVWASALVRDALPHVHDELADAFKGQTTTLRVEAGS